MGWFESRWLYLMKSHLYDNIDNMDFSYRIYNIALPTLSCRGRRCFDHRLDMRDL